MTPDGHRMVFGPELKQAEVERSRINMSLRRLPLVCIALAIACPPAGAQSDEELRKTGECSALGYAIMQEASKFPQYWREASLPFMLSPMVLADNMEVPFKDNPTYQAAFKTALQELQSQPPSSENPAYASRFKPCMDWTAELLERSEKNKKAREEK